MSTLQELYALHEGKVSDKWTQYLRSYDRLLSAWRTGEPRLLEIGVQNGGSLEIWSRYFPRARALIGCDINPRCDQLVFGDSRITLIIADANTDEAQARVNAASPVLDIVLDDGSHRSSDIVRSFARYFPMLADDGIFIAEDLHCSYWSDFEGGLFDPTSSISFFKLLADIVNHEHWGIPEARARLLQTFARRYAIDIPEDQLSRVHSVEFINSLCVVRKAPPELNVLGPRVVSGHYEFVVPGHHELAGSIIERFDQASNVWSAQIQPHAEIIEALPEEISPHTHALLEVIERQAAQHAVQDELGRAAIAEKNVAINALQEEIEESRRKLELIQCELANTRAGLDDMRASRSWRYTAWLRKFRSRLPGKFPWE